MEKTPGHQKLADDEEKNDSMNFYQITQLLATLLTGLIAGLFYAYQCSVIGGLGQLGDKAYVMAFQSINKVILNPWFFASFMGCLLVLPLASWLSYGLPAGQAGSGTQGSFYFLLVATLVYFVGVFGVTIFGNVPLNETLANFNVETASAKELFSLRQSFEIAWNKYNLIRTLAAVLSFLLCILSILKKP